MKKILLSIAFIASIAFANKLHAQCTVSKLSVEVKTFNPTTCQVTFNLSWDQEVNGGNKYAYIHLWKEANYHTPAANWMGMYSIPTASPAMADLATSLGTISIFNNGSPTPSIGTTYPPDGGVTPLTTGLTVVKTPISGGVTERMTIKNVTLNVSTCSGVVTIKGDVWASQASNGKNVHCVSQGLLFNLNNPQITSAFKVCNPRSITFGIKNNGASSFTEHYLIYRDDGDGIFEPTGDDAPAIITGVDTTLAPGGIQSRVQLPYPGNVPGETKSFWLEVAVSGITSFTMNAFISNSSAGCLTLPVNFKSFTAARNHSNVSLKWETSSEQNSSGFAIERNIRGTWEQVAFVPSQAAGGNSNSLLSYQFNDLNNITGISQYRVREVDFDTRSKYSEIRAVRGEGQTGKTIVYPNPSFNGKVNIVFEDASVTRDASLSDMSGRVLKQWKGVTNNNIQIDNLAPGMYSMKIVVSETGEQSVEKIIVSKY